MPNNPTNPEDPVVGETIAHNKMMDELEADIAELCEKHKIADIVLLFTISDKKEPAIYWNCHYYEAAKLLAGATRQMKTRIDQDLAC